MFSHLARLELTQHIDESKTESFYTICDIIVIIFTKLLFRSLSERETYLILINLSNEPQIIVDLRSVLTNLPRKLHVVAASPNSVNQKA